MRRDPRTYLWDARPSASEIVGEALDTLRQADPELAAEVPDLARIVAFRNVLIHGYTTIDDRLVWDTSRRRAPQLIDVLSRLLARDDRWLDRGSVSRLRALPELDDVAGAEAA